MTERVNYDVTVRCVDCHHEYVVDDSCVNPSTSVIVNSQDLRCRLLVVVVQNECPRCHNLRVAGAGT